MISIHSLDLAFWLAAVLAFGMVLGRALTLLQMEIKLDRAVDQQSVAPWWNPHQPTPVVLHPDQDCTELPPPSLTAQCHIIHYGIRAPRHLY